jgi:RNA polymerase sigma factor (sigma-70 family)
MPSTELLTQEEYDALANDIRIGKQPAAQIAKEKIAVAYMPLARNIAKKYVGKLGDLAESAAYMGLTMAVNSWNPDKGALPSWIRLYCKQCLLREVDRLPKIKMPQEVSAQNALYNYYKNQGIDPKERLNLTDAEVEMHKNMPKVGYIEDTYQQVASLTEDNNTSSLVAEELLSLLSPVNQIIVKARFGIGYDGYCHTYEEIAELVDMPTQEVIRREILSLKELKMTPSAL